MHDSPQRIYANKGMRILSYTDPTNTADKSNGEIFLGAVFLKGKSFQENLFLSEQG